MDRMPGIVTQLSQYGHQEPQWTPAYPHHGHHQPSIAPGSYTSAPAGNIPNHQPATNPSRNGPVHDKGGRSSTSKRYGASSKYKRNRTIFNVAQLDALAKIFEENRYPDAPLRKKIADRLEIDEERVQIWFQNRRAKTRRSTRKDNSNSTPGAATSDPNTSSMPENSLSPMADPNGPRTPQQIPAPVESSPRSVPNFVSNSTQRMSSGSTSATLSATTAHGSSSRVIPQQEYHGNAQRNGHSSSNQPRVQPVINSHQPSSATSVSSQRPTPSNQNQTASSSTSTPDISSTESATAYTQHYVSNENGHTSRVHVNNEGRSTEGRLRPETRVVKPPPNQVCTQIPDKDKNALSKALFRFGLMIGQSAGLDVDTSQLEETPTVPEEPAAPPTKLPCQKHLPAKKRRRPEYRYPASDTSSDSDDDNPRKRYRRIPNGIDRSGPPNRLATAVPESDRTLPAIVHTASANAQDLTPVFENFPDTLIDETCSQVEKEPPPIDALDVESPFSIDILSSPEPRSSPKSPSSTSTSSMSDWSDFDDPKTVPKPTQSECNQANSEPSTGFSGNSSEPPANSRAQMSESVHPLPRLDQLPCVTSQHTSANTDQRPSNASHNARDHPPPDPRYQPSCSQPDSFRHRSFSDPSMEPAPHHFSGFEPRDPSHVPSRHHSADFDDRNPPNVTAPHHSASFENQNAPNMTAPHHDSISFEHRNPPNMTAPHNSASFEQRNPPNATAPQHSTYLEQQNPSNMSMSHRAENRHATAERQRLPGPNLPSPKPSTSESAHNNEWTTYDSYLQSSSSSSACEENRRNQVSEILAESRQIADCMSSSSTPASPFSEESAPRSPASWSFPKSPPSFTPLQHHHLYESTRADHYYSYPHASASVYDHHHRAHSPYWTSASMTPMPPHTYANYSAPTRDHYPPPSFSRTEGSSHSVIRPVAKLPSMSSFPSSYRSSIWDVLS